MWLHGIVNWIFHSAFFRNWANEPNNLGGLQHCGLINNNGRFGDESCDTLAYYVCKTPTSGKVIQRKMLCNIRGPKQDGHLLSSRHIDNMHFEILPKASAQKGSNLNSWAHWKQTNKTRKTIL